jgi:cytochrome oxidase Cu insertion factor (SCO1/SenC/PrrC family)
VAQGGRGALSRRWLIAIGLALLGGALVGVVAHLARAPAPSLHLPAFHGQAGWPPGARRTPNFVLRDQNGRLISPGSQRGRTLVVAFLSSTGHNGSAREARALADAEGLLARQQRPVLDIVGSDPVRDTPSAVAAAARAWGLADSGEYHWLDGAPTRLAAVRRAFGVTRATGTGAIYLIDRDGFERAGYLFPFLPNFVALDLHTLSAPTH